MTVYVCYSSVYRSISVLRGRDRKFIAGISMYTAANSNEKTLNEKSLSNKLEGED